MGPSGSGKTTLLNFLSGRLTSDALKYDGEYRINGEEIKSMKKYANNLGYVMQEDLLLGTMTPWESFKFVADLKLEETEA